MNKEEIINILTKNLGMVDYIDVTKYISNLEGEINQLKYICEYLSDGLIENDENLEDGDSNE